MGEVRDLKVVTNGVFQKRKECIKAQFLFPVKLKSVWIFTFPDQYLNSDKKPKDFSPTYEIAQLCLHCLHTKTFSKHNSPHEQNQQFPE